MEYWINLHRHKTKPILMSAVHTDRASALAELVDYPENAWRYQETLWRAASGKTGFVNLRWEAFRALDDRDRDAKREETERWAGV